MMSVEKISSAESRRYVRQMLLPQVGKGGQERLKNTAILVVGIGGLGCPVVQYLAAIGIGRLGLVDGDAIDESNLHRQVLFGVNDIGKNKAHVAAEHLRLQNPFVHFDVFSDPLTHDNAEQILMSYDLVVDCSDNFLCRYLINDACVLLGKPFVSGAVQQFEGQVSVFNYSGGPCYRCLFPSPVPPGAAQNCAEAGVMGVVPGLVGLIQANEVAKIILGVGTTLAGRVLIMDGLSMTFKEIALRRDLNCAVCADQPSISDLGVSKQGLQEIAKNCEAKPEKKLLQITRSQFNAFY